MNTPFPVPSRSLTPAELLTALSQNGAALTASASTLPAETLFEAAHDAMRLRRWADAAWIFDRLTPRDAATELKRFLSRNLAALQQHRDPIYRAMMSLPTDDRCGIGPTPSGRPTLIVRKADGTRICLSAGPDPVGAAVGTFNKLKPTIDRGETLGVCGVGDGYLIQLLAQHPPRLFMDMQHVIFLVEPDAQVLFHSLMIHDFSGPHGPIEQARFLWFVGAEWREELTRTLNADLFLPSPAIIVNLGLESASISDAIRVASEQLQKRDRQTQQSVESYYAGFDQRQRVQMLGSAPPRQPRALLLTTRFSTVLQYSTRDTADALRRLGWDARVLIETSPNQRLFAAAMRQSLADFKPDLVLQLDHLRYEHQDLFPPNLPFICWIQDHLPNLRTRQASESITNLDFVLTDAPSMYVNTFGYPEGQCISLSKLTPEVKPMFFSNNEFNNEMVFVSNASHVSEGIVRERLDRFDGTSAGRKLLQTSASRLMAIYADGGAVANYYDVLALMRQVRRESGGVITSGEFDAIAAWISHPLNDSLYRQQALRWAADVAEDAGLKLALYGSGWENHPDFADFACGPVAYGAELARLTRRSRINLQIVPYLCLHQRLLDGLMAGGFFLIRSHVADTTAPALLDFLAAHAPEARTSAAARSSVSDSLFEPLNELIEACRPAIATSDRDDPVTTVWDFAEMRLLQPGEQILPRFDLTSFSDASGLRGAVTRFLADPKLATQIQQAQRASVADRLTYDAGMSRVLESVRQRVASITDNATATSQMDEQDVRRAV